MPIFESIRRSIQQHKLISPSETVVLGVSGGADSLALMHVLWRLQPRLGFTLHVATLDHGWRGEQSAADVRYVLNVADSLGLKATAGKLTPEIATKSGLEAAARRGRYQFLARVAEELGAMKVATAHHADDQAETVLLHLLRGSGLQGLQGMGWQAPLPDDHRLTLIRPMLGVRRADVEAYCEAHQLVPRHDPSNKDPGFLRNRLRLEVMPQLQAINPQVVTAMVQLADIASTEDDFISQQTEARLDEFAREDGPRWRFPRAAYRDLHPALQRRVLRSLAGRVLQKPDDFTPGYSHIVAAQWLCLQGEQGAVAQLTQGVQVRLDYTDLVFEHEDAPVDATFTLVAGTVLPLPLDVDVPLQGGVVRVSVQLPPVFQDRLSLYLPPGRDLHLRTRRPGDRIQPPGLGGHSQKLKDWMINRKVPASRRDAIPLLVMGDSIVAIVDFQDGVVMHPWHKAGKQHQFYELGFKRTIN